MNKFEYKNLTPFKWFVLENFPFIEADFDALTSYQLWCKVVEYLNKVIDNTNLFGEELEKLSNYINNLDLQDEVNNKLDEMVESGYFDNLLTNYINLTKIYNTTENMIQDKNNLVVGQNIKTLGYSSIGDKGGSYFKITAEEDNTKFQIKLDDKYATMITKKSGYVEQFGDDTEAFQNALKYLDIVYLQDKIYTLEHEILLKSNNQLIGTGNTTIIKVINNFSNFRLFYNENNADNIVLKDFKIDLDGIDFASSGNVIPRGHIAIKNSNNIIIDNITDTQTLVGGETISDNQPIWILDCSNVEIKNCNIYHYGTYYTGHGGGVWIYGLNNDNNFITIKNNKFFIFGDEAIGFYMRSSNCSYKNIKIEGNEITTLSRYFLSFLRTYSETSEDKISFENTEVNNNRFIGGGINFDNAVNEHFRFYNNYVERKKIDNTLHSNSIFQFNRPKKMNDFIIDNNYFLNSENDDNSSLGTINSKIDNFIFNNNTINNFYNGININNSLSKIISNYFNCININLINSNQKNEINLNTFNGGNIGLQQLGPGLNYSRILSNTFISVVRAIECLRITSINNFPSNYDNNEMIDCSYNFVINEESSQITPKQLLTNNKIVAVENSILVTDLSSTNNLVRFNGYNNYRYNRTNTTWAEINIE